MKKLNQFTNQYQLSKTLRFELKPQGKTLEHIHNKGLIQKDEERANSYQKMKQTIDGYHKYFIELAMSQVQLTNLNDFNKLYLSPNEIKKEDKFKKDFEKVQSVLRKEIVKGFKSGEAKELFTKLFKKELITELLKNWIKENSDPETYFDDGFDKFTSYFTGFHENRKNMYTDKEQSTAIAYRLIHENLPKFIDNIKVFEKVKKTAGVYENCSNLYSEIEEYLNISTIDDAFELDYFNETLTQKDIDVYNLIIGGRSSDGKSKKTQGLNEYINLYNQKQTDRKQRIPKLKQLYKQILSDRVDTSFVLDKFEDDEESGASQKVLDAIENYYKSNLLNYKPDDKEGTENILDNLKTLFSQLDSYELDKIYVANKALTTISKSVFGDWGIIKSALEFYCTKRIFIEGKKPTNKQIKSKENFLNQDCFSIKAIENAIFEYRNENELLKNINTDSKPVRDYSANFDLIDNKDLSQRVKDKYSCIKGILCATYPTDKKLNQDKVTINNIKTFLDALMDLFHFVKTFSLPNDSTLEKDQAFYNTFEPWFEQLEILVPLYNKVRNFSTQKPYSVEKFKLNFENVQLLGGWDANKERDYLTSIFRKDGNYYLAVMNKQDNKVFQNIAFTESSDNYEKMHYKLLPGVNKMLPKVFFSKKNLEYYSPSDDLLEKYKKGTHKKGDDFNLNDCHDLIDFFKSSLNKHPDWKHFKFKFSDTSSYDDLSYFYREVSQQGYKVWFNNYSTQFIDNLVEQGKLYLFQIYNKDFSKFSKGKPNLHTMYWHALFDSENLQNVIYKLNGQAEMFYRKQSINHDDRIIHHANQAIDNKNPDNPKKQSAFDYDLIKDKRYTVNKFQFHVPITMNFKATGGDYINVDVLNFLKNNPDINIIGIDRGERHLIYVTLINQKGVIKEQFTLNDVISCYQDKSGKKVEVKTSYHKLLDQREKERDKARKDWGTIENIKELKEGYISQVVHKIATMMIEHNAIVVMEDLNFGFKRGRFKVEKQVYQKLEKRLIDKLNYLVLKDKQNNEAAGIYKALQLTNKFESFQKLGKQSGFLFYVPAWNTSKIDPTTGFVNLFDTRYKNTEKAITFFETFESISFNLSSNQFEFAFDYSKFTTRADGTQLKWTVCTNEDRIITFRNKDKNSQWENKTIQLTDEFIAFFKEFEINHLSQNLQQQIIKRKDKLFLSKLLYLFKLTLQMRNSKTGTEIDYLISPVKNKTGSFYDSRNAGSDLPKDADANGAYHIAQKGLWVLQQINQHKDESWKKFNIAISNKEWLKFAQSKAI